jgi:hypothetical protein
MNALQGLNPRLLIGADDMNPLVMKFFGLVVQFTDFPDFASETCFVLYFVV